MVDYGVPDELVINRIIDVNQTIPHPGNSMPLDTRKLLANGVWDMPDGFADDFNASGDSPFEEFIPQERVSVNAHASFEHEPCFVENVL
jgi:hypothetical protein